MLGEPIQERRLYSERLGGAGLAVRKLSAAFELQGQLVVSFRRAFTGVFRLNSELHRGRYHHVPSFGHDWLLLEG